MTPRLLLNSTKPKDYARWAREERCEGCVCVCVLILYSPFCIYSREPRVRTTATDFSNQWRGNTWRTWGDGAHGPGRPTCRSVDLPGGPTAPNFVQQAVLGLLVQTQLVLTCLEWSELCSWDIWDWIGALIISVILYRAKVCLHPAKLAQNHLHTFSSTICGIS